LGEEGLKTCVKARITQRESFLLRAIGKLVESSQVIQDYLLNRNDPQNYPELNAIHRLLATSMAESLYENEEFNSAHEILHRWKILGDSHHEIAVSRKGMILNGIIHLNEGNYHQAKEFLEGAFETYDPLDQG
jgi:tetratricopeptide (TPR) repeat protein